MGRGSHLHQRPTKTNMVTSWCVVPVELCFELGSK